MPRPILLKAVLLPTISLSMALSSLACTAQSPQDPDGSATIVTDPQTSKTLHEELVKRLEKSTLAAHAKPGVIAVQGGVHVKLLRSSEQRLMLPLPLAVDHQVPITFAIQCTPPEAAVEFRIQEREHQHVLMVKLKGERSQEIQIDWSAAVLVYAESGSFEEGLPDEFLAATACAQSNAPEVQQLADRLWQGEGKVTEYVRGIQTSIREMEPVGRPRSLDAVGILKSGNNGICTANANLALALLRAKGIAARSLAVVPPLGQRLEMHRIVEYNDGDQRRYFDPSSLHAGVPMTACQTILMAKTSVSDEEQAMKPRMGSSIGVPYGQEIELITRGVTLAGQDFFWTVAKPVSHFEPDEDAVVACQSAWKTFVQEGRLSDAQIKASAADDASEFAKCWKQE